jgi:uncharacterized membrane protein
MPANTHAVADEVRKLGQLEKQVIDRFIHRKPTDRNPNVVFQESLGFGDRVADRVAAFGGSWTFIGLFTLFMVAWMIVNARQAHPLDPFPFILLNLMLSCVAAMQAPVIMMSQNRQAAKDRLDAQHDYEVNLKAEMEIVSLHLKMDELREKQWATLIEIQNRQLEMLARLESLVGGRGDRSLE